MNCKHVSVKEKTTKYARGIKFIWNNGNDVIPEQNKKNLLVLDKNRKLLLVFWDKYSKIDTKCIENRKFGRESRGIEYERRKREYS